jgi:polyisoprenyl-teichoic acid--peptidoglycan teichoic acid transferase
VRSRWKRALVYSLLGIVVVVLALGGGFYLWFHNQVGAANARVDPDIIAALHEKPSTTLTTVASTKTTATTPTTGSPSPQGSETAASESTTTSEGATTTSAPYESPSGMNVVLLGYDKRADGSSEETEGRSDVIILVHIDPEKHFLSLLSVPRDLRAEVEGYGHRKINAAYAYGGGALLIRTIQNQLGVDLDHYIAVDLTAFRAITDSLGGVYVDVDRSYDDGKIVLDPGYQLLDGLNAERFCRTRHDQNIDFGRSARQQRYLSAVRQQVMKWNLPLKLPGLIKTIFQYADTDLSTNEVLKLAYWVEKLDGDSIKRSQITGPTGDINGSFYILPSEEQIAEAVDDFFTPPTASETETAEPAASAEPITPATLSPADLSGTAVNVVNSTGRAGQGALVGVWLDRQGASVLDVSTGELPVTGMGLVQYPGSRAADAQAIAQALGIQQVEKSSGATRITVILGQSFGMSGDQLGGTEATALRLSTYQALEEKSGIALMAPSYMPSDYSYSFDRSYDLDTGDGTKPAVRVGYRLNSEDLDAGVSATTWTDAPLASPGVKVSGGGGIVFTAVGSANKTDHVWWVKDGVLYWVSNTIFADLSREQMLAIALSSVDVPAGQ